VFLRAFENSGIEDISRFETGEGSSAASNVPDVTDVRHQEESIKAQVSAIKNVLTVCVVAT